MLIGSQAQRFVNVYTMKAVPSPMMYPAVTDLIAAITMGFRSVCVCLLLMKSPALALAGPVTGQGNWETWLAGRDGSGNAVPMIVGGVPNPALMFIFDAQHNLSWLANWSTVGRFEWRDAMSWAASLSYNVGSRQISNWRLPRVKDTGSPGCNFALSGTDCGYNVQQTSADGVLSEFALMWYERLGNTAWQSPTGTLADNRGLTNTGPFLGMQEFSYWTSTELIPNSQVVLGGDPAFYFDLVTGSQFGAYKWGALYAVAVREGDVAEHLPEPGSISMLCTALGIVVWVSRRNEKRRRGAGQVS